MQKNYLVLITIFLSVFTLFSQTPKDTLLVENVVVLDWQPTFKMALKKSKKQNKPVLIYFTGSDWCSLCKILDEKLFHILNFKEIT